MNGIQLVGIGSALVDILGEVEDGFLGNEGLPKGGMTLVDAARIEALCRGVPGLRESSGGSIANTIYGFATFGGRGAFIGRLGDDRNGWLFTSDMASAGVICAEPEGAPGPTGSVLVMVTPDSERTMCTHLGVAAELSPVDLDPALIAEAEIVYVEGYLLDSPSATAAISEAARNLRSDQSLALSLSDPGCVDRHRDVFHALLAGPADILFANEREILALTGEEDFSVAVDYAAAHCRIACLTRSAKGSVVVTPESRIEVAPVAETAVDSTGAGDLYAAGFLFGHLNGLDPATSAYLGSVAGADAVTRFGARPGEALPARIRELAGCSPAR